jgi:hypothetical protein
MVFKATPAVDRFWARVARRGPDECWEWTGGRGGPLPYGRFWPTKHRPMLAHRYSYELHNGPIPPGMMVCHSCDNPPCVNPAHLWLGTGHDNQRDRTAKGRGTQGGRNGRAKLSPDDVAAIRADPRNHATVARDYGVTPETVSNARRGVTWR